MKRIRRLHTKAKCKNLVFGRKPAEFPNRFYSNTPQEEKWYICGWGVSSYIEGTTHVKCLNCGASIKIPKPNTEMLAYD